MVARQEVCIPCTLLFISVVGVSHDRSCLWVFTGSHVAWEYLVNVVHPSHCYLLSVHWFPRFLLTIPQIGVKSLVNSRNTQWWRRRQQKRWSHISQRQNSDNDTNNNHDVYSLNGWMTEWNAQPLHAGGYSGLYQHALHSVMHFHSISNGGCHHTDTCHAALQTHSSWQQSSMSQGFCQQIQVSYFTFPTTVILSLLLCPMLQHGHATAVLWTHYHVSTMWNCIFTVPRHFWFRFSV